MNDVSQFTRRSFSHRDVLRGALDAADVLRVDVVIVVVVVLVDVGDDVGDGAESQHHHGQEAVRVESVPGRRGAKWKCNEEE